MTIVLASQSSARRALLDAACVPHEAVAPLVDEDAAKTALRADGCDARSLADALAELKAMRVSQRLPSALVVGCDQVLETHEGTLLNKPASRDEAADQLRHLRGKSHKLLSAAVACENGRPVWRAIEAATLTIRPFSDAFLSDYLDAEWPAIGACVGGYRFEGRGIQLFSRVVGSHAAIVGLPLLPLLGWLRERGALPA